jgi:hypothetical protein
VRELTFPSLFFDEQDYYHLPRDATIRDVALHVRADEAAHRETNHHIADKYAASDIDSPVEHMIYKRTRADELKEQLNGKHRYDAKRKFD